jgi:hypothetical protein
VTLQLATKPGINGANTLSIPKEWDATWFRHFLSNSLHGADVRNAIGANGIKITGNISTPYATISVGGASSPLTAPIIINPTAGFVSLTVNGNASTGSAELINGGDQATTTTGYNTAGPNDLVLTTTGFSVNSGGAVVFGTNNGIWNFAAIKGIALNGSSNSTGGISIGTRRVVTDAALTEAINIAAGGGVTIQTPASGAALTITQNIAAPGILVNGNTSSDGEGLRIDTQGTSGSFLQVYNSGTFCGYFGSARAQFGGGANLADLAVGANPGHNLVLGVNQIAVTIAAAGNVAIAAPSSALTTLTVNGQGGAGVANTFFLNPGTAGERGPTILAGSTGSTDLALIVNNAANSANLLLVTANGRVTVGVPAADGSMLTTATTLPNNSGALVGTLTNSPVTGNPTKWIAINDNGTIRRIPTW